MLAEPVSSVVRSKEVFGSSVAVFVEACEFSVFSVALEVSASVTGSIPEPDSVVVVVSISGVCDIVSTTTEDAFSLVPT